MIEINNVYSVRKYPNSFIHKKFEYVIPIGFLEPEERPSIKMIAIDDNVESWDPIDRSNVIKIYPFSPVNNSINDLLSIVSNFEKLF
jgi:hypothetical protein